MLNETFSVIFKHCAHFFSSGLLVSFEAGNSLIESVLAVGGQLVTQWSLLDDFYFNLDLVLTMKSL